MRLGGPHKSKDIQKHGYTRGMDGGFDTFHIVENKVKISALPLAAAQKEKKTNAEEED